MIIFKTPWVFLLILPVVLGITFLYRRKERPAVNIPTESFLSGSLQTWRLRLAGLPFILRLCGIVLLLVALSGPRSLLQESKSTSEGISILLALDVSTSMAAEDFVLDGKRQSRLTVVKNVVGDFIRHRKDDRIGLIAFAAKPYPVSPLTLDHSWLEKNLERIDFGLMEDGTAIGSAIAAGVSRLKTVKEGSRIMVVLTDGINNAGRITPLAAARMAKSFGIKVYTIGTGTRGLAPYPVVDVFGRKGYQNVKIEIDEASLQQISRLTGGHYFRATDTNSLKDIYEQIDRMEKAHFDESGYRQFEEHFPFFLISALCLFLLEAFLSRTFLLQIP